MDLDLQQWYNEKSARPEMSDLLDYFGWDAELLPEVLMADDERAVEPSKENVMRLNDAICALSLEVVVSLRRDAEVQTPEESVDETGLGETVEEREVEETVDGKKVEKEVEKVAARNSVTNGDINVDYLDDPTTGGKLWQPRRLFFNSVETC